MSEHTKLFERAAARYEVPNLTTDGLLRRRDRKRRNQRIRAGVLGLVIAIAVGWLGVNAIRSTPPVPADDPEGLGIFAPVAGRIVYVNGGTDLSVTGGTDLGYDPGLWAVDPNGPSDKQEGPSVADDVASTLVRLDLDEDAVPRGWSSDMTNLHLLGWSSDGTELLFWRWNAQFPYEQFLYILHADGSETRLNKEPMVNMRAAFSPDGSRVALSGGGLYVVDAEGGRPVRLRFPAEAEPVGVDVTFSPDGTRIAYLTKHGVGVVNADGTDAHEILANEETRLPFRWVSGLQWSPAGDRIAIGLGRDPGIYTFAPDGSDFTKVISGGISPYWSPDGSQIAYTIPCDEYPNASCPEGSPRRSSFDPQPGDSPAGLAIADADGSNIREFGFAASGPWHPGTSDDPTSEGEVVLGWPDTNKNPPGVYSWDGSSCASTYCSVSAAGGFMHNGYGSGDVEIRLDVLPEETISDDGATAVTVAGHDGIYRRIDTGREEWIVDIEGTTIAIRLTARPGTSQTDLADAYAIVESMRTEAQDNNLGFRLVFTLTTNDWDSG
jgi:Tol biopolymer transport system component